MNKKDFHIHQACQLLRQQHSGVLASISLSVKGFPFGSVTPFLMTEHGDIVIYASDIAQHSRNMKANDKVSLCVHNGSNDDSQANARVTILGLARVDAVSNDLQEQYFKLFPQALKYVDAHDFRFYLIQTERVRYIGGFGEIYWFSQYEWQSTKIDLSSSAAGAIQHMHEDHGDALAEIVGACCQKSLQEENVKMLTCYQHGFHYAINNKIRGFVPFEQAISEIYPLRLAMVELTKTARNDTQKNRNTIQDKILDLIK